MEQYINGMMIDNFVQIKTGQGKSVTLATVSIIFALYGYNVSCACYSAYLSQRDYSDFKDMFEMLDLGAFITYGTFNQICENYINKDGSIRDIVLAKILKTHELHAEAKKPISKRPQILLVDEVDVFFSKDFYN